MKKILFALVATVLLFSDIQAQNSNVIFGSTRIPQINNLNPAFYPSRNTFYLSLPGVELKFHGPLSFNDIFQKDDEKNITYININTIADNITGDNNLFLNAEVDVIGMGLNIGNTFVTLSAKTKASAHLGIPSGLIAFFQDGNYGHRGYGNELYLVDGNLFKGQVYNEFALGVGHKFKNLTVGMRLKLLNGVADLRTDDTRMTLYTADDMSLLSADMYYRITATGISKFQNNDITYNSLLESDNWGYSLDLGAKYDWSIFEFSASILDIGKGIKWKDDVKYYMLNKPVNVTFDGVDFTRLVINGQDTAIMHTFDGVLDSLKNYDTIDGNPYWTRIPTKFNLGATVHLGSMVRAGLLFHGEIEDNISYFDASGKSSDITKLFRNTTTLMAGVNLYDWIEVMASMAVVKDGREIDWFNPGLGVNLSLFKSFQMYLLLNYISDIRLVEAKSFNLQFGLNLLFGKGHMQ